MTSVTLPVDASDPGEPVGVRIGHHYKACRYPFSKLKHLIDVSQQQRTRIRTDSTTLEIGHYFS